MDWMFVSKHGVLYARASSRWSSDLFGKLFKIGASLETGIMDDKGQISVILISGKIWEAFTHIELLYKIINDLL